VHSAHIIIVGLLSAALFPILPASAQNAEESGEVPSFDPTAPLDGELRFGLYRPRVTAMAQLGAGNVELDLEDDLRLDDAEDTFNVELTLRRQKRWQLRLSGLDFSTDTTGQAPISGAFGAVSFAAGDAYRGSLDFSTLSIELGFDRWRPIDDGETELILTPFVGARWIAVDQQLASGGIEDGNSSSWMAFSGGFQFRVRHAPEGGLAFGRALDFEIGTAIGYAFGGDGGVAWQIHANATLDLTDRFGIFFGYRLVEIYADDGDYRFEGGLQGLFAGAVIRF
jgi:hypothetical protein